MKYPTDIEVVLFSTLVQRKLAVSETKGRIIVPDLVELRDEWMGAITEAYLHTE